jgi:hypothetical protein
MIRNDNRAVSIAITHALTLGITAVLITGLLLGAGGLLEDQETQAARGSLSEIASDTVSHINSLDNLNATGEQVNASVRPDYPARIVGHEYTINITNDASNHPFETDYALVIRSDVLSAPVWYPLETTAELDEQSEVEGGQFEICLTNAEIRMGGRC